MRFAFSKCPHCGHVDFLVADHTCPCPYSNYDCPDHKVWTCRKGPVGWHCASALGHEGSCPMYPKWWNLMARWDYRG